MPAACQLAGLAFAERRPAGAEAHREQYQCIVMIAFTPRLRP